MSDSAWIHEPETDRYYVNWDDGSGTLVRRYSDELDDKYSTPAQSSTRQDKHKTPRSESSRRGSSSKPTSKGKSSSTSKRPSKNRKDSGTSSSYPKHGPIAEDEEEEEEEDDDDEEPVVEYGKSRGKYHHDRGYSGAGEVELYDEAEVHEESPETEASPVSPIKDISKEYHEPRGHDWADTSGGDALATDLERLTMEEVEGNPQYPLSTSKGKGKEIELKQGVRQIFGTPGEMETLDSSYKVRNNDYQKFFRPGRVFSMLWSDPYADETGQSLDMSTVTYVIYGQKVHTKIRRMIVVKKGDRCCWCVPVYTYDGRGYKKRGINLKDHGLIYSEKRPSKVSGITKEPLKVILANKNDKLATSYINFGKVYTVETNVKVKNVGELDQTSRGYLYDYYTAASKISEEEYGILSRINKLKARNEDLAGVGAGLTTPQDYLNQQPPITLGYPNLQAPTAHSYPNQEISTYDHLSQSTHPSTHYTVQPSYFQQQAGNFNTHPTYNPQTKAAHPAPNTYPGDPHYPAQRNSQYTQFPGNVAISPAYNNMNRTPSSSGQQSSPYDPTHTSGTYPTPYVSGDRQSIHDSHGNWTQDYHSAPNPYSSGGHHVESTADPHRQQDYQAPHPQSTTDEHRFSAEEQSINEAQYVSDMTPHENLSNPPAHSTSNFSSAMGSGYMGPSPSWRAQENQDEEDDIYLVKDQDEAQRISDSTRPKNYTKSSYGSGKRGSRRTS